jgi:hypothetical protein
MRVRFGVDGETCRPPASGSFSTEQSREPGMSITPRDGLIAVVKRDCPTCELTVPVLGELAQRVGLRVYTQDDPSFPENIGAQSTSPLSLVSRDRPDVKGADLTQ